MKIKKFNEIKINESNNLLDFSIVFNKYIKNQKIKEQISIYAYGDYNLPIEERYYGNGVELDNGYKILYYGGGCSGEDCNTTFIVDDKNKLIAKETW
jgi:hypothetical protein